MDPFQAVSARLASTLSYISISPCIFTTSTEGSAEAREITDRSVAPSSCTAGSASGCLGATEFTRNLHQNKTPHPPARHGLRLLRPGGGVGNGRSRTAPERWPGTPARARYL